MKKNNNTLYKFLFSGVITTGIDFLLYIFFSDFIILYIAKFFSMSIAMIVSFFINRFWCFNDRSVDTKKSIPKFIVCQIINLGINTSANYIIFILLSNKIYSFISATLIATIINFILQKNYVFYSK